MDQHDKPLFTSFYTDNDIYLWASSFLRKTNGLRFSLLTRMDNALVITIEDDGAFISLTG
jgi:hypothetical protein